VMRTLYARLLTYAILRSLSDTLTANECDALFRSRGFAWVSQVYGIVGTASLTGVALFHFEAAVYVRVSGERERLLLCRA
jgi:hypothetical protein